MSDDLTGLLNRRDAVLMETYAPRGLVLTGGSGVNVTDSNGKEYIDMIGGIAVNVLGHGHPALTAAIAGQAGRLIHTSNLFVSDLQVDVAERLVASAFPSRVFFANSGAEANEAAIKIARKWGHENRGGAGTIICMTGAFHGRTLGALSATAQPRYRQSFEPLLPGFVHVPFDDLDAVAQAVDDSTVAIMAEPILGEQGVVPMQDETLRGLRRLCDDRNLLLILDEIQTGMARTGRWWAHQHAGVTPDVMTVAKALGGGVPVAAVLAAPRADVLVPGDHGSTFGGNHLAMAAARAVIDTINAERLAGNAAEMGERLREGLLALGTPISEVRGRGLMLAAVLDDDLAPAIGQAAAEEGVLVNPIGQRLLRLLPPLTISVDEVDEALRRIGAAIATVTEEAR